VQTQAAVLTRGEHEHERAAGAWHAKWGALSNALALAGGAAAAIRECLEHLEVHTERMRENMSAALVAERVAFTLDRETAVRAFASGDPRRALEGREELLDPTTYLGSAEAFVDRALERHERGG